MTLPAPAPRAACLACGREEGPEALLCPRCQDPLELRQPPPDAEGAALRERFDARLRSRDPLERSGVWRFRELIAPTLPRSALVTRLEGNTGLLESDALGRYVGLSRPLLIKHEGLNPTGSFKDRGMVAGISAARWLGRRAVCCASTGNTSASLAAYASACGMAAVVLVPKGKIAFGKLAQALAYGARVLQVPGGFDDAMARVESIAATLGLYLLNSVNPWRVEGQKAIGIEALQDLGWRAPDWIALPAGNLGNTSALGKGLVEARAAGLIAGLPRILPVQAAGASPFYRMVQAGADVIEPEAAPETVATAIRIGRPRSWRKALAALSACGGAVEAATDAEILDAKAAIDAAGVGCEPASAASVAGVRKRVREGTIAPDAEVVCILTGHMLKDPDATVSYHEGRLDPALYVGDGRRNPPVDAPDDADALAALLADLVR